MPVEPTEPRSAAERALRDKLRASRLCNAVAATVADGYRQQLDITVPEDARETAVIPLAVMYEMLGGVIAALGGETDPAALNMHPELNLTQCATLAHLVQAPLEDR